MQATKAADWKHTHIYMDIYFAKVLTHTHKTSHKVYARLCMYVCTLGTRKQSVAQKLNTYIHTHIHRIALARALVALSHKNSNNVHTYKIYPDACDVTFEQRCSFWSQVRVVIVAVCIWVCACVLMLFILFLGTLIFEHWRSSWKCVHTYIHTDTCIYRHMYVYTGACATHTFTHM